MFPDRLRRLVSTPAMIVTVAFALGATGCPSTEHSHDHGSHEEGGHEEGGHEDGGHEEGGHEDGAHDHASEPEGGGGDAGGHVHVFKCPDHPEVTSGKAGDCSECGKKLEHQD